MATDLGVSITVSAVVGGALSGLTNIGKAMNTLKTATETLNTRQKELGNALEINKDRLGVASAKQLWQEYDKIGASIAKLKQQYQLLNNVRAAKEANSQQWENVKSQWQGAVAAAGTLLLPVKLAVDFESSMADVKKVVNFDTPQQFKEMEKDILRLTREIPMAGKEIAAIVAAGGQSGVARENLTGFASDAAKMGVAFDMAAGQAGESMATLSNVLQIPIAKIGRLGDAINHLSDNANSKASDIVNVLTRVGSDTKQLGLTENQAAALGSTFLSMGKAPELAAQAMKGLTTSFSLAKVGKFDKELERLGLTSKDFAAAMEKDAQGAISNFLDRVKTLPKNEQYPLLMEMFGTQYADDALMLANNVGEYNRQLKLLEERDASGNLKYVGSMQREFANRSATTANQFQIFKNGMAELAIAVGSVLLPTVNEFLGKGIKLANMVADWSSKHPVLTKAVAGTAASLLAFRVGIFGAMVVSNRARAAYLSLKGAFLSLNSAAVLVKTIMRGGMELADVPGRLGTVMRAFAAARTAMLGFSLTSLAAMWPVVAAVGAIAVAALLIYKYWQPIKGFFAGLWAGLKQGLEPIRPVLDGLTAVLSGLWAQVQPYVQPIIDWFADFFSITQVAEGGARNFGQAVGQFIGGAIASVAGFIGGIVTQIQTAFSGGLSGILALIVNWSPLGAFYQAFSAVLGYFGIQLPASLTGLVSMAVNAVSNLIMSWSPVAAFQTAFAAVWGFMAGLPSRFVTFGSQIVQGLVNGIRAGAGAVVGAISNMASSAMAKAKSMFGIHSPSRVFRSYGDFITRGLDIGIGKGADKPVSTVGAMAGRLKNRFAERMGQLRSDIAARVSGSSADFAAARAQQAAPVSSAASGALTVHFSPTIHAPGGDPAQIQTAVQMGLREFEQLFNRLMADRERRSY